MGDRREQSGREERPRLRRAPVRPRFFVHASTVGGDGLTGRPLTLSPDDAHHARTVLRVHSGDPCEIVVLPFRVLVGAEFCEVGGEVTVVAGGALCAPPAECRLVLVQALPRPKKVDGIVRRGTEAGVDDFLLVPVEGSPSVSPSRLEERVERWRRVGEEAAKQSRQMSLPHVEVIGSVDEVVIRADREGWISVATDPCADIGLLQVLRRSAVGPSSILALWVGPEGGWSEEEISCLEEAGMECAHLGWRILRTENAGPMSAALVRSALSYW